MNKSTQETSNLLKEYGFTLIMVAIVVGITVFVLLYGSVNTNASRFEEPYIEVFQELLIEGTTIEYFHKSLLCDKYMQYERNVSKYAFKTKCGTKNLKEENDYEEDTGCFYMKHKIKEIDCVLGFGIDCSKGNCFK